MDNPGYSVIDIPQRISSRGVLIMHQPKVNCHTQDKYTYYSYYPEKQELQLLFIVHCGKV